MCGVIGEDATLTEYRRKYNGRYFFFTVNTFKRRAFLCDDGVREKLRIAFKEVQKIYPYKTLAFCLLPDHLHCIWQLPKTDVDYSRRWGLIKSLFSKSYISGGGVDLLQNESRRIKRERGVWQRRFWEHRIRDEQDMRKHIDYIHYNPVKHGYVESPADWPFSTYGRYKS